MSEAERIAALEKQVKNLAEIVANLLNEREAAIRNMGATTRALCSIDQRLCAVEKVERKAARRSIIIPNSPVAGHG